MSYAIDRWLTQGHTEPIVNIPRSKLIGFDIAKDNSDYTEYVVVRTRVKSDRFENKWNQNCKYYSGNILLPCAVNISCENCKDFEVNA
jgi:hypothetical protein